MEKANIIFLEMLSNVIASFPSRKKLDKDTGEKYIGGDSKFVLVSVEWCEHTANELRKMVLEERMGDETEI